MTGIIYRYSCFLCTWACHLPDIPRFKPPHDGHCCAAKFDVVLHACHSLASGHSLASRPVCKVWSRLLPWFCSYNKWERVVHSTSCLVMFVHLLLVRMCGSCHVLATNHTTLCLTRLCNYFQALYACPRYAPHSIYRVWPCMDTHCQLRHMACLCFHNRFGPRHLMLAKVMHHIQPQGTALVTSYLSCHWNNIRQGTTCGAAYNSFASRP